MSVETLAGGTWNLRATREPRVVRNEVRDALHRHDLDWLCVQEAWAYVGALGNILGYRVVTFDDDHSAMDSAILVRREVPIVSPRLHRLSDTGWPRPHGPGEHWPRSAVSAILGSVRVMSLHYPPGGPTNYRQAFAEVGRSVERFMGHDQPRVAVGDMNASPDDGRDFTSAWVARQTGATIHGKGIDHVIGKGVHVGRIYEWRGEGTSDHALKTFTVRPKEV